MFYPVNGDPFRSSVVLHLPMTGVDNGTTFTDVSPSPKTITRYNALTKTGVSKWGQGSGYFDGNGDYLGGAFNTAYKIEGDFTVESWVYFLSDTGTTQIIASFYDASGLAAESQWLFYYNKTTTKMGFDFRCSDGTYEAHQGTTNLALTTWHHLMGVKSGTDIHLFANGSLIATVQQIKTISNPTAALLGIGAADPTAPFAPLHGYLQDLRITKGVARYTADFTMPAGPLPIRVPELPVRRISQPSFNQIARLGL